MNSGSMWDKLLRVEERFEEVGEKLTTPEIIADREQLHKLSKEHKDLTELVATFRAYRKVREELQGSREIIESAADRDMVELAVEESRMLTQEIEGLEQQLKVLLMPKDPNDDKNIILEIRAGAGGDEAGIFAGELLRMYTRYAERRGWKMELMSMSDASAGGFKEVIAMVSGEGAFSRFKYEAGVHRVQRVPKTETQGRVHTSTVTVVVLPEAEEVEIDIQDKDIRIDVYRSGGHGGQSVNTTDSAVRITHLPTNTVVAIQDEKSQLKNKDKAMKILRARLYEKKKREADALRRADTKSQIGMGDRSEKIRTYNFPQSRITDHRINVSIHNVEEVMAGEMEDLVDQLTTHYQAEALRGETEQQVKDIQIYVINKGKHESDTPSVIWYGLVLFSFTTSFALKINAQEFETAVVLRAENILPKALLKGPQHSVRSDVESDGYMKIDHLHTKFGDYQVR